MACSSSFEPLLDEYVDGALAPRERALVAAHLSGCEACAALLEEVRVIDALLLGPRTLEPAPNFSFKVMAEVRALPVPHRTHVPHLRVLVAYLAFAWSAIGLFVWLGDGAARAALVALGSIGLRFEDAYSGLATATERLFGPHTLGITAAMSALLVFDLGLALVAFAVFYFARHRAAARAESREAA